MNHNFAAGFRQCAFFQSGYRSGMGHAKLLGIIVFFLVLGIALLLWRCSSKETNLLNEEQKDASLPSADNRSDLVEKGGAEVSELGEGETVSEATSEQETENSHLTTGQGELENGEEVVTEETSTPQQRAQTLLALLQEPIVSANPTAEIEARIMQFFSKYATKREQGDDQNKVELVPVEALLALQELGIELEQENWQSLEANLLVRARNNQRWRVSLSDLGQQNQLLLSFDYVLQDQGVWVFSKAFLHEEGQGVDFTDSLAVVEAFLAAIHNLNIAQAEQCIVPENVSNVQLAALCMLLEEQIFSLQEQNLQWTVQRPEVNAFIVGLIPAVAEFSPSQLALILHPQTSAENPAQQEWKIVELSFDRALAEYAQKMAPEDTHYSPLVDNPDGGQLLSLYFEFDQQRLTERSKKQLHIVAQILLGDTTKSLVISGHTDALGSSEYNRQLGYLRAVSVRDFLQEQGVKENQISLTSFGDTLPVAENFTPAGEDNPEGRQENRRAEILLDF